MSDSCPDLEILFAELAEGAGPAAEHAKTCPACAALVAEHAEMERELFHLSDPLPPSSFVPAVMARIAASPQPARREVWAALSVLAVSVAASAVALFTRPDAVGHIGVATVNAARSGVAFFHGLADGLSMLWHHAAFPAFAVLCVLLMGSLYGLKKLAGSPQLGDVRMAR